MNRRSFLTRSGLALGALVVGDEVLEAMERLTHRKVFPSAAVPRDTMEFVRVHVSYDNPFQQGIASLQTSPDGFTGWRTLQQHAVSADGRVSFSVDGDKHNGVIRYTLTGLVT
jgi:hypothetical protein